jgi:hypothetical protein
MMQYYSPILPLGSLKIVLLLNVNTFGLTPR